jgi:hypothetical protein
LIYKFLSFLIIYNIIKNDKSLTTFPKLPVISLAEKCYSNLFEGCTELINAPELPFVESKPACYNSMFKNCSITSTFIKY